MSEVDDVTVRAARTDEIERIARLRARCYRDSYAKESGILESTRNDRADFAAGDVLLTELGGRDVATATSFRGDMNVRGTRLSCQGVAWVGTTHDARRGAGVASVTMKRMLELARERGDVLSALCPFRASYYEHFGYGLSERRMVWSVPTNVLPTGDATSFRFVEPDDEAMIAKLAEVRVRQFEHARLGHGDMLFPKADHSGVKFWIDHYKQHGYVFADLGPDGSVRGWIGTEPFNNGKQTCLDAQHMVFDTPDGFMRQLHFLATLKDQYGMIEFVTPADRPIHLLLRETQLPHRHVEHPHATTKMRARNQVRILDHVKTLSEPAWPNPDRAGGCVVRVHETEGHATTLRIDVSDGRCEAKLTDASPDFECADKVWAPIILGELRAPWAATHGLATGHTAEAVAMLDDFSRGPIPFCREYY